jgi:hypothetical protein
LIQRKAANFWLASVLVGQGIHGAGRDNPRRRVPNCIPGRAPQAANFAYRISLSWWIFRLTGLIAPSVSILPFSPRFIGAVVINTTDDLPSE